jgi:hypothetical protein
VVEGARLESVYTSKAYRGFESLPLRQNTYLFKIIAHSIQSNPLFASLSFWDIFYYTTNHVYYLSHGHRKID